MFQNYKSLTPPAIVSVSPLRRHIRVRRSSIPLLLQTDLVFDMETDAGLSS
jgi:hypothetical protein